MSMKGTPTELCSSASYANTLGTGRLDRSRMNCMTWASLRIFAESAADRRKATRETHRFISENWSKRTRLFKPLVVSLSGTQDSPSLRSDASWHSFGQSVSRKVSFTEAAGSYSVSFQLSWLMGAGVDGMAIESWSKQASERFLRRGSQVGGITNSQVHNSFLGSTGVGIQWG